MSSTTATSVPVNLETARLALTDKAIFVKFRFAFYRKELHRLFEDKLWKQYIAMHKASEERGQAFHDFVEDWKKATKSSYQPQYLEVATSTSSEEIFDSGYETDAVEDVSSDPIVEARASNDDVAAETVTEHPEYEHDPEIDALFEDIVAEAPEEDDAHVAESSEDDDDAELTRLLTEQMAKMPELQPQTPTKRSREDESDAEGSSDEPPAKKARIREPSVDGSMTGSENDSDLDELFEDGEDRTVTPPTDYSDEVAEQEQAEAEYADDDEESVISDVDEDEEREREVAAERARAAQEEREAAERAAEEARRKAAEPPKKNPFKPGVDFEALCAQLEAEEARQARRRA